MEPSCPFPGCPNLTARRGLCYAHYRQMKRGGELRPLRERVERPPTCTYDGCDRPHAAFGLCKAHRGQQRRGEPLHDVEDRSYANAKKRAAWESLTSEERADRMRPAIANLDKRGKHWRDANAAALQKVWREGRGRPRASRSCIICDGEFMPNSGPQVICSQRCRRIQFRAVSHKIDGRELLALYQAQNDQCAICGVATQLVVDHDHTTDRVRGLLCTKCNTGLGKFGDSVERLREAIAYLER